MVVRAVVAGVLLSIPLILPGVGGTVSASELEAKYRAAATAHQQRDYARSLPLWHHLAEQGLLNAQFNLGQIYYFGDGVVQDYPLAMQWFKRAAEQGDKAAQAYVGSMYLRGDGVPADATEAHRWFVMNREHHRHHDHDPTLNAWREQARALLWQRDMAASFARSQRDGERLLAELQRRAVPASPDRASSAIVVAGR